MKKLLAVLLSVVMTLCLTVPAFAAPDPEAAALGVIGGADGPTAIITTNGPTAIITGQNWMNTNPDFDDMDRLTRQAMLDAQKKALGGVPGQIGLMVNGAYVQFPDAAPEMTGGRTMVPVRALVEALGGEVTYGDRKDLVRLYLDEYTILVTIGSTTAEIMPRGTETGKENKSIEMDCAPYIKDGRTYVPIRFISEALGYEVGWDAAYQTAILLDRDALAAEIDKEFTILNKVQASQALSLDSGKNYSTEMKGSVTVTAFDTLNGNKTYKADLAGKTLLNAEAVSGSYSLTLSDNIIDLLLEQMEIDGEDAKILRGALKNLKDMQGIMTEQGKFWVHAPALDEIGGKENIWVGCDMGLSPELMGTLFSSAGTATMGTAFAALVSADSVTGWAEITQAVEFVSALYGDKNFTTSNGVSTLAIGPDELASIAGVDAGEMKAVFKECQITMRVDSKGEAAVACRMETAAQADIPTIRMTVDCTQSGGKAELTMTVHVANLGKAALEFTATQKSTSEKPMTQPPAGAALVESPELLNP